MSIDQSSLINPDSSGERDGIDIAGLVLKLWKNKGLWLIYALVFVAGTAIYLNRVQYVYTAGLVVTPADQSSSKMSGGLSGLGSLVGVNLGGHDGSTFAMHSEAIRSRPVAERLSRDPRIMHTIFAGVWDERLQRWREPKSRLDPVIRTVKSVLGLPIWPVHRPGAQELQEVIDRTIIVTEDNKKGLVRLSFDHPDPAFAGYFLDAVTRSADDFLRQRSLVRSRTYVRYLEKRLQEVQVSEYRTSLSETLGAYEKTVMMASSEAPFAAESFGSVTVSSYPTSPNPKMVLLLSVVAATLLWAAYVLVFQNLWSMMRRH